MFRTVAARPGLRRLLVPYFLAASLRREASSVAGLTGKTAVQRLRNSAFFARSHRNTRTARPNNQRISRQTILSSSTWSANHHHHPRRLNGQVSDVIKFPGVATSRPRSTWVGRGRTVLELGSARKAPGHEDKLALLL